jgi:hypothetical protein
MIEPSDTIVIAELVAKEPEVWGARVSFDVWLRPTAYSIDRRFRNRGLNAREL